MTLSEAFGLYSRDVIAFRNQSFKTEEHLNVACRSLVGFLGEIEIEDLSFENVRAWKQSLEKRKLSVNTIRGYLNKLRVVLKYLAAQRIECLDAALIVLPKRVNQIPVFITPEEVSKLIKAIGLKRRGYPACNRFRNQAVISLLYASGIRIGELCRLNREDIYQRSFTVMGKGGKPRLCFIDTRTEELLGAYLKQRLDNNPALFLANQTQARIRPDGIQRMMNDGWRKAQLSKPVHPHSLRHSFATNLLRNNCNMRYLQALLGHSSLETTQIYAQVVDTDLAAIYAKYHSV